ncbi:MAG TPA: SHOCT domain-containing protein [Chromatiales bacterium]|nr:SHOCT domain-containing protein [Thiotrichales bacterium]HIP69041.1 SHOCT domain-containing protein [Chromatiales bacterium]
MVDGHWLGGGVMWLFWIVLIVVVLWAVKSAASNENQSTNKQKSAQDILKERYARGEIDEDEFERRKRELKK